MKKKVWIFGFAILIMVGLITGIYLFLTNILNTPNEEYTSEAKVKEYIKYMKNCNSEKVLRIIDETSSLKTEVPEHRQIEFIENYCSSYNSKGKYKAQLVSYEKKSPMYNIYDVKTEKRIHSIELIKRKDIWYIKEIWP